MAQQAKVIPMTSKSDQNIEVIRVTPKMAERLLENNKLNRKLSQKHVERIAKQIEDGHWKYNGDTIKIGKSGDILDGQHRLWAVLLTSKSIKTIVVRDIEDDAFATVDTLRKLRSGADALSTKGVDRHRVGLAQALTWLVRYQRAAIVSNRKSAGRVENADVLEAYKSHPNMLESVERCASLRQIVPVGIMAFTAYVLSNIDDELVNKMIETMHDPSEVAVQDPFFQLRTSLLKTKDAATRGVGRNPVQLIGLIFKAWNLARDKKKIKLLTFRIGGQHPENLPTPK